MGEEHFRDRNFALHTSIYDKILGFSLFLHIFKISWKEINNPPPQTESDEENLSQRLEGFR